MYKAKISSSPKEWHNQKSIGPSDSGTIVPSTHCPTVLYWRLSDFNSSYFSLSTFLKKMFFCKKPDDSKFPWYGQKMHLSLGKMAIQVIKLQELDYKRIRSSKSLFFLAVGPFNMWLISSWEENIFFTIWANAHTVNNYSRL